MPEEEEKQTYNRSAGPVQKQTVIVTSAAGLTTGLVDIPARDRAIPGYFAHPAGRPNSPLLLVLSETFGLHEHIRDIARRFAHEGFFAVAPDLMVRQGDPSSYSDVSSLVQELLLKIPDEQVMADLDATIQWGQKHGADTKHTGITGFCWGGRWTWLYAAHRRLNAAVAWYGILDGRQSSVFHDVQSRYPTQPIDAVSRLQTPILGLYGGKDDTIPLDTIQTMQADLKQGSEAAQHSNINIYPEAGHAFFADYRATYQRAAAEDAWHRCLEWLEERS